MLKHHLDIPQLNPRLLVPATLALCVQLVLPSALVAAGPQQASPAQSPTPVPAAASIESIVTAAAAEYLKNPHAAALSIGVVRKSQQYAYHFGSVDKSTAQRPSDATLYPISSISKTFVGTLLAQAVLDRKLTLDDDIRSYLDGDYANLEFEGQPIRLYHLLNHRSGLPFILPDPPEAAPDFASDVPFPVRVDRIVEQSTRKDFYAALHRVVLRAAPGARFQYSNAAAQLAGYILERVYGASFEVLLREKVTGPLAMHDTIVELSSAQARRVAPGYDENGTRLLPESTKWQGAGAIKSTLANMLTYAHWQLDARVPVVALSHTATYTDGDFSIGLNWQMQRVDGRTVIWQDGATPGFASFCILQPDADLALVILSNELDAATLSRLSVMANTIMQAIDARCVTKP